MLNIEVATWLEFTTLASSRHINMQYVELADRYEIYLPEEEEILFHICLLKDAGPDVTDFETNYKPNANEALPKESSEVTQLSIWYDLSQGVSQLSQIISNTGSTINYTSLLSQEVTQLSTKIDQENLMINQLTDIQLIGYQEIAQLSQIITNTGVAGADLRPYLSQEITQLSTKIDQENLMITQLTNIEITGSQQVAQLSQIITNTAATSNDYTPLFSQEISQLTDITTLLSQEVGQLSTKIAQENQMISQLTNIEIIETQQVVQLTNITVLETQQVSQLSQIITNTAASSIDYTSLLSQEVTQLSTKIDQENLMINQLTNIQISLSQQVVQLSQEINQLTIIASSPIIGLTMGQKAMTQSVPVTLATDQTLEVPTDMFIAIATKNNQMYSCGVSNVNAASQNTDNPLLLLRNPTASVKTCFIKGIRAGTMTANRSFAYRVWANPTVTVIGITQTSTSLHFGGGAPAASVIITTLPTISSSGTQVENLVQGQNSQSYSLDEEFRIQIKSNNSLLLTGMPSGNNTASELTVQWAEA